MTTDTINPELLKVEQWRRPAIKLPQKQPHIVIAVPVGSKAQKMCFPVPPCDKEGCDCPNHGKNVNTEVQGNLLVPVKWATMIPNLVTPLNTTVAYLMQGGMLSSQARDLITHKAIEIGAKYIFYWDDDVIPPPLALYTMHNILESHEDIGLVTGVYCTRENPTEPLLYKEHGKGAYWGFSIDPSDPPEDIFACGGGCILAKVEDIKKMEPPYWTDEQKINEDHAVVWGHDVRFVSNFKKETGKRTVVQGSILCGHWDAEKGVMHELPRDSLPYKKLNRKPGFVHEIIQLPEVTPQLVDRELRETGGERRIWLVPKAEQRKKSLSEALRTRFEKVKVISQEKFWLAVVEGLKTNGIPKESGMDQFGDQQFLDSTNCNSGIEPGCEEPSCCCSGGDSI